MLGGQYLYTMSNVDGSRIWCKSFAPTDQIAKLELTSFHAKSTQAVSKLMKVACGSGTFGDYVNLCAIYAKRLDHSLLYVCKQMHRETEMIPFRSNSWVFTDASVMLDWMRILGPRRTTAIRKIVLQQFYEGLAFQRSRLGFWQAFPALRHLTFLVHTGGEKFPASPKSATAAECISRSVESTCSHYLLRPDTEYMLSFYNEEGEARYRLCHATGPTLYGDISVLQANFAKVLQVPT